MQRTAAASIFIALTRSRLSGNTPCECVQTVSLPSWSCATAQDGPIEVRAIARRTQHPAVHHAGKPDVLDVGGASGHLGGNVAPRHCAADNRVTGRRLRRDLGASLAMKVKLSRECAVAEVAAARRA